jgi:hypothetical protein
MCAWHRVEGNPDPAHISTGYAERQNQNIRMGNRRITRLTNVFSKKGREPSEVRTKVMEVRMKEKNKETTAIRAIAQVGIVPRLLIGKPGSSLLRRQFANLYGDMPGAAHRSRSKQAAGTI